MQDATPLPNDVTACHSLIAELSASLVELHGSRQQLTQKVEQLELLIAKLLHGHRRERFEAPNQLKLDFSDDPQAADVMADAAAEAEQIVEDYTVRRRGRKQQRSNNDSLPDHFPRYEVTIEPAAELQHCPVHGPRQLIGYDQTETLELERPKFRVRVTKYPKYACPRHADCGVGQAVRRPGLVEGDRYDTSVATEIITAKYGYHLPFYRQQDVFAESGWTPSRSTLLNILVAAENVLRPLVEFYRQVLLAGDGIGCDETTVTLIVPPVLPPVIPDDPRSRRTHEVLSSARRKGHRSVTARIWAYRAWDLPINVFDFTVSRTRHGPDEFLQNFTGLLLADCWAGFQKIELRSDARIVRAACWAHARRKVFDGRSSHPQQATVLLAMISELYDIEGRAKEMTSDERLALRQLESRRVLERIRNYLDSDAVAHVLPKSVFAEATHYLRNHWDALNVFLTDGQLPLDNNDVEQLMKQVALGRKNWLFLGSVAAGVRAANLLTIVSTAVRNDLDVSAYLQDILNQLLAGCTDYASLRADIWKQSHPEAIRQYRSDERRDAADRQRFRRAQRRLAPAPDTSS